MFGISIILFDLWNNITGKILLTTITIFGFSIPGLSCSINYEKSKNKLPSTIGMITCFISGVYILSLIWGLYKYNLFDDLILKLMFSSILLSISFGHICLLLLINPREKVVKYFKNTTIGLSITMDLLILLEIFTEMETSGKLIIIIAILVALGTIVTPLLDKLSSKPNDYQNNNNNKYEKLAQLKKLLDDNAITQEEYEKEKNSILNN